MDLRGRGIQIAGGPVHYRDARNAGEALPRFENANPTVEMLHVSITTGADGKRPTERNPLLRLQLPQRVNVPPDFQNVPAFDVR